MKRSLTRTERIRKGKDFARVFVNPDYSVSNGTAKLVVKRNGLTFSRFAVTTVRKYGNAVQRNRARRLMKEIYRNSKASIPSGMDVIVVLFSGNDTYRERKKLFMALIRRIKFAESVC